MSVTGEIKNLYSNKDKTRVLLPRTKTKAVSDENGTSLNVLLDNIHKKIDGLTYKDVNAASGAYGLGASVNWDYPSANDIQVTGFYACNVNVPSNAYWYGMHIRYDANSAYQYFVHVEQHYCAERHKINGEWQPWEWVNPPMTPGVEYRTIERYLGKPVYAKVFDCGTMPANNSVSINHGIANIDMPVRIDLLSNNGETFTNHPWFSVRLHRQVVYISTNNDNASVYSAKAILKYTKTTD